MSSRFWWQGAVIYQVYPRSLMDSNNDGIGDLPGIIEKLDYIQDLGVDAIWISPFFKSPMKDFGYDISDYLSVDPIFGTLDDFDKLIEQAHQKGIKIIIDQVLSHTSDQHEWFLQSRENRSNAKSDWYVWADAKEDGTPPNNWLSIFGGGAWQWEPRRQQYYLHNFLTSQPDLNFHHPEVVEAALDNIEFWLQRGVDGFRLDAINFCYHDKLLRNNPAKPVDKRLGRGFKEDNPYAFQYHYYNNTQPENIYFIEKIRALLNRYPGSVALGEISSEDSLATTAEYTDGDNRLHMGYSFELLTEDFSADYIKSTIESLESQMTRGWPCFAISNHDVARVATRWGDNQNIPQKAKLLSALLTTLRGSVCIYQGEELGLEEADIPFDQLQDPYGIAFWPSFKGRDGCRTPIPWDDAKPNAGFSEAQPWLPVAESHLQQSVRLQQKDPQSVLNSFKKFLAWRKEQPALLTGRIEFLSLNEPVLGFYRISESQKMLMLFNLSNQNQEMTLKLDEKYEVITEHGLTSGSISDANVSLPPYGCLCLNLID
ncbi:MAG: alpha-amylase family glycosyl hydrolase [Gammaproteobacteria bacterium]|nr:alpha-amylase family glycosyl hydrolase [Gammaproteobacteria bacterium]